MVLLLRAESLTASCTFLANGSPLNTSQKLFKAGFMIVSPSVKGRLC